MALTSDDATLLDWFYSLTEIDVGHERVDDNFIVTSDQPAEAGQLARACAHQLLRVQRLARWCEIELDSEKLTVRVTQSRPYDERGMRQVAGLMKAIAELWMAITLFVVGVKPAFANG